MALKETLKESKLLGDLYDCLEFIEKKGTRDNLVFIDSALAILLANNLEHHSRTKHVDIKYRYVRECVRNG